MRIPAAATLPLSLPADLGGEPSLSVLRETDGVHCYLFPRCRSPLWSNQDKRCLVHRQINSYVCALYERSGWLVAMQDRTGDDCGPGLDHTNLGIAEANLWKSADALCGWWKINWKTQDVPPLERVRLAALRAQEMNEKGVAEMVPVDLLDDLRVAARFWEHEREAAIEESGDVR